MLKNDMFIRILLLCCFFCTVSAFAEVSLDAYRVSYDSKNDIISAEGDVIIRQFDEFGRQKRELQTESVEYHRKIGIITLKGKSVLKETTGEIITSDGIEIKDDFKKGIIKAFSIIMKDRAWIDAESGEKNDNVYSLIRAKYSPCYENKDKCTVPLWDLYADKVTYDSQSKMLTYKNVRLRMKGHTILYSPYFSHPSFDVKRKSGFVTPMIHANNDTGTLIGIPYFWALSDSQNLKVTPFLNFRRRGFILVEYKEALSHGDLDISSSFLSKSHNSKAVSEDKNNRWNIAVSYRSVALSGKRLVFDIDRSSDVTYLIKYPVSKKYAGSVIQRKCNTSKVGAEFFDNSYFLDTKMYFFQIPNKNTVPFVFPKINFQYEQDNIMHGIMSWNSDLLCLSRNTSNPCKELRRLSNKIGWKRRIPYKSGIVLDALTAVRTDAYFINYGNILDEENNIYPIFENNLALSYPMYSEIGKHCHSVWGPKVSFTSVRASKARRNLTINEDSLFPDYNELNLYAINRIGGIDNIEHGERITYGIENSIYKDTGSLRLFDMFIGKANMLNSKRERASSVGRLVFYPAENFSIRTRFVGFPFLEPMKMFELGSNVKIKKITFDCAYFGENRINRLRHHGLSQIGCSFGYKINTYWEVSCSQIYNLKRKAGKRNLSRGIFCKYKDECFEFGFGVYKSRYKDMDLKQKTGIMLTFAFKNLGEISHSAKKYDYKSLISKSIPAL